MNNTPEIDAHSCIQRRHHCGQDRAHSRHHFDAGHGQVWCCPGQRALGMRTRLTPPSYDRPSSGGVR